MADTLNALQQAKKWFEIIDYAPISDFQLEDWIEQIMKRAAIQNAITAKDKDLLNTLVSELIEYPLASESYKNSETPQAIKDLDYSTATVIPLGFNDLNRIQNHRQRIDPMGHIGIDAWALQNQEQLFLKQFGHLKVNLKARDADILANFQHWLTTYRATVDVIEPKRLYNRKNFAVETADWHKLNVLPYFDLTAWAVWSGVELTDNDKVDLLYPDDTSGSVKDKLRQVQAKTPRVLTMDNAMVLSAQVKK